MGIRVVALCGGVGGARLLDGLAQCLEPESLTAIVNTGDDFRHWGLWISPDLDTCMYTLAGLAPVERGWGREVESFHCFETLSQLGGEDWFQLGDRDLAIHLRRTSLLEAGRSLTATTSRLCQRLGVAVRILPMTDAPRQTLVHTKRHGVLPFQRWLVVHRGQPEVSALEFVGETRPSREVLAALMAADVVIIAPSNPYVSIDPIVSLDGVREAVGARPVIAVSPIVGGQAVKGPLAEMMPALTGEVASAAACAAHYGALVDGFVAHNGDAVAGRTMHTDIVMRDRPDRRRLASEVLAFAQEVRG